MREFFDDIKQYVTPCNTAIIVLNILVLIVERILNSFAGVPNIAEYCALSWWQVFEQHEYYRLFSYMFFHSGFSHLFNNMLVLAFIGSTVERIVGHGKYLINYLCCGFVAALASIAYNRWAFNTGRIDYFVICIGASGAVFGMVGALLWIVIRNRGQIAGIGIRQLLIFLILSIYAGFADVGVDNIAHIGGLLFGVVSMAILYDERGGYV